MPSGKGWPKQEAARAIAGFESRCPECSDTIEEGDEIIRDPLADVWICVPCAETYELI